MAECTRFIIETINNTNIYYIQNIVLRKTVNNSVSLYLQGCGAPYWNIGGANVRLTVDILGQTVVDQTRVMPGCFLIFCSLLTFTFTIPNTVNGADTAGRLATIKVSWPGDTTRAPAEQTVQIYVYGDPILVADKTSANTGESITFSGQWYANQELNIYYNTTDPYTGIFGWREHIVKTKTDTNGDFKTVAILPSTARDQQGNPITGPVVLEFRACPPGFWPTECSTSYISNIVPMTISPSTPIGIAPGIYTKNYPMASTYSGPARSESMHISSFKYIDIGEGKPIGMEEAVFNIMMVIENAAIIEGLTLLKSDISYSEGLIYYEFDVTYTMIKPPGAMGNIGLYSLAIPLLYAALAVAAIIIGLLLIFGPPEVKDLIWKGIGAVASGILLVIGVAVAAFFILPRIAPTLQKITAPKDSKG